MRRETIKTNNINYNKKEQKIEKIKCTVTYDENKKLDSIELAN